MNRMLVFTSQPNEWQVKVLSTLMELSWNITVVSDQQPEISCPFPVLTPVASGFSMQSLTVLIQHQPDVVLHWMGQRRPSFAFLSLQHLSLAFRALRPAKHVGFLTAAPWWGKFLVSSNDFTFTSSTGLLLNLIRRKWIQPGKADVLDPKKDPEMKNDLVLNELNRKFELLLQAN